MEIRKIVNDKVIAFNFNFDIINSNLLLCICTECHLEKLFIEVYTVEKKEISVSQKLLQMGFNIVNIPYKNGTQDVAINMNACELPVFFSMISEYDFEEITIWSANERWEQHLFLKSANSKIYIENENDLYLYYNYLEKKVELYLNPNYDADKISSLIQQDIAKNR